MPRPVCLFTGQWADLPLETLCKKATSFGYDGLELACWGDHFDVQRANDEGRYAKDRWALLADHGLRCYAIANHLVSTGRFDRDFVRRWVNWEEYLRLVHPDLPVTFDSFVSVLKTLYGNYTFDFAARESGVDAAVLEGIADEVAACGGKLAAHNWRSAAAGNLGGGRSRAALVPLR